MLNRYLLDTNILAWIYEKDADAISFATCAQNELYIDRTVIKEIFDWGISQNTCRNLIHQYQIHLILGATSHEARMLAHSINRAPTTSKRLHDYRLLATAKHQKLVFITGDLFAFQSALIAGIPAKAALWAQNANDRVQQSFYSKAKAIQHRFQT